MLAKVLADGLSLQGTGEALLDALAESIYTQPPPTGRR
jgi:hypothetical protein